MPFASSFVWINTFSLSSKKHLPSAMFTGQANIYQHLWMGISETTFSVKGWLGPRQSLLTNGLDSQWIRSTWASSWHDYAFLVAEGVKRSQSVKCVTSTQNISIAKILKYKSRNMYFIVGIDTVGYFLHVSESVKN